MSRTIAILWTLGARSAVAFAAVLAIGCAGPPRPIGPLVEVASGLAFAEGPAADRDGNIYFTDQPNDRIWRWDARSAEVTLWLEPSGRANGMEFDAKGRLIVCADGANELRRITMEGAVETLVDSFGGALLNGPNDAWVHPDGSIYFTDPWYRRAHWSDHPLERRRTDPKREVATEGVYRVGPEGGEPTLVVGDLVKPNGIVGSPDGRTLYVADIGAGKTFAYPILDDGRLGAGGLVVALGSDGMAVDEAGNLYLTGEGVHILSPSGETLGRIAVPRPWTSNVAFAGPDRRTLFITAGKSAFTVRMSVPGPRPPRD
jgi:gluconolactonase